MPSSGLRNFRELPSLCGVGSQGILISDWDIRIPVERRLVPATFQFLPVSNWKEFESPLAGSAWRSTDAAGFRIHR